MFLPSAYLQTPSSPITQGYTPMLEEGLGSTSIAPVGTGQVTPDMSLNDKTQQVLDQANEILAQPQLSPFQQFLMDNVDPLGIFSPEQAPQAVRAPIKNITPREEAGPKSYTRKGETPDVAFSPDFGFDIFPEGFYGQSEVRGTEAGPPEFDPTLKDEEAATQEATVVGGDQRNKAVDAELKAAGFDTTAKEAVKTALDEYLKLARPGVEPKNYDEYIKEFGEATGLDVSGEPDNKMALMAFGLALMQNKAGKGFDVGEMLSSVGEAGEKAMPALQKAREQAKAIRAKAGEYALSRKKEDQAAAMARQGYYIVPKEGGFVNNFDKGRIIRLNSYELNNLDKDVSFGENFEIVPMSVYEAVAKEAFKEPELGNKYASSYDQIALFEDAPEDLRIGVQRVDANYKGADRPSRGYFNPGEYETYMARLRAADADLDRFGNKLAEAYAIVEAGETTTFQQITDATIGLGNALGMDLTDEQTPVAKVKRILNVIAAEKAPEILGEAGKTISDADRERVKQIAGELSLTSDPNDLKKALDDMYERVVAGGKRDIQTGIVTLNTYANIPNEPPSKKGVMTEEGVLDLTQ